MHSEVNSLEQARCIYIVTQYMLGQGWQLVDSCELAERIWRDVTGQNLSGREAVEYVQNQVWQRYAAILHDGCCQSENELHNQAWGELSCWLTKQVRYLTPAPHEPDVLIQETLSNLHHRLSQSPIKARRAFFAYALQIMRRKNIDLHRRRTAVKRGGDDELYLEELEAEYPEGERRHWEEKTITRGGEPRAMEKAVITAEIRQQIRAFFHAHLLTTLQRQVAEAHFLDGLSPVEIARLMGKRPHEIRMLKARVVKRLRSLPPDARQSLLDILGAIDDTDSEAVDV
ncbi:MAG: sigma-70 family RNA polymerase sigma factor [Chloroflexi bacterium]|nr:sigma-70 family RNA polymerase sigma factor [Chloroflexota bacterium]